MEETDRNEIFIKVSNIEKLILIDSFVQFIFIVFLIDPIVNISHKYEYLSKYSTLEIDIIIISSMYTLPIV